MVVPRTRGQEHVVTRPPDRAGWFLLLSAACLLVTLVAPILADVLWLALAPAVAFLLFAVGPLRQRSHNFRIVANIGSTVLRLGCSGLLLSSALGAIVVASLGLEPAWIGRMTEVAALIFVVGLVLMGIALFASDKMPRWAASLFALGLPLGYTFDVLLARFAPPTTFLMGYGFVFGTALFVASLLRISRALQRDPG